MKTSQPKSLRVGIYFFKFLVSNFEIYAMVSHFSLDKSTCLVHNSNVPDVTHG